MASGTAARGRAGGRAGRMLRCLGSLAVGTGGAAALEFAFAAIILLSLTMGVIDIGRAMHTMNTLEHAVKEGSRYASIHGSQSADGG